MALSGNLERLYRLMNVHIIFISQPFAQLELNYGKERVEKILVGNVQNIISGGIAPNGGPTEVLSLRPWVAGRQYLAQPLAVRTTLANPRK